jgi:HSP20 family protein
LNIERRNELAGRKDVRKSARQPREREKKEPVEVDLGFGLGGIFKGLGNFIELLGEMTEEGQEEVTRTGEVKGPGRTRAMYGFTVKIGAGGVPEVERFGTVRAPKMGAAVEEVREPVVDVFDEGNEVVVIAEMPGVEESDIQFEIKEDILLLSARHEERKYSKEVLLPCAVLADTAKASYANGILELRVTKASAAG